MARDQGQSVGLTGSFNDGLKLILFFLSVGLELIYPVYLSDLSSFELFLLFLDDLSNIPCGNNGLDSSGSLLVFVFLNK
jgi:hypothetical protein